jgi:hypothetical protein
MNLLAGDLLDSEGLLRNELNFLVEASFPQRRLASVACR